MKKEKIQKKMNKIIKTQKKIYVYKKKKKLDAYHPSVRWSVNTKKSLKY